MYILAYGLFIVSYYKPVIQFECMKPVMLFLEYFTMKLQELQEQIYCVYYKVCIISSRVVMSLRFTPR